MSKPRDCINSYSCHSSTDKAKAKVENTGDSSLLLSGTMDVLYDHDVKIQLLETQLQLEDIESFLRQESQNRVIDRSHGAPLFECLAQAVDSSSNRLPQGDVLSDSLGRLRNPEEMKSSVCDLLSKHSKQFQSVIFLLAENFPASSNQTESNMKEFYETVVSDCKGGRNLQQYTKLCLYAASTCINAPIYVLCRNEFNRARWSFFKPLFTYDGQPESVLEYVTMAITSENVFYNVESREVPVPKPNATGLLGMYIEALEDISPLDIDVPEELLSLSDDQKSTLCRTVSRDIVLRSCILFLKRRFIQLEEYNSMTAHRASREQFYQLVTRSADAFQVVCQVLIKRQDKSVLTKFVHDWNLFVKSCDFLHKFDSLCALDNAIYKRNVGVSSFVDRCQLAGQELDERRKAVTTAVIASSSVGIVSGGMVIAGLVLAPFSFGASLGLSIAGGVIGVGTGVAAGTARTVEAVKQNSKMNDIKAEQAIIQGLERDVSNALEKAELLFKEIFKEMRDADDIGISKRGFLAVGSAFRASNSIAHIALAAARLSATAATVSAAVLGPLSLAFDIAFLAEAAHSKATGDKTNAGEILQAIAETIETKSKIFNSMLRGNLADDERIQMLRQR